MHPILLKLGARVPIVLSPMAGVSSPALAAAVSNAGGIGSIGIGSVGIDPARAMIRALRAGTDRAFNVNLFAHQPPRRDRANELRWIERLAPRFAEFGAAPPAELSVPYGSLVDKGEGGFGAQWAGQGAPLARRLPAIELMATLEAELRAALGTAAKTIIAEV